MFQAPSGNPPSKLSGTGDSQRDLRESIRANHSQLKPLFYSVSGLFARITRISDSRESPNSRESCESIRANHATKLLRIGGSEKGGFPLNPQNEGTKKRNDGTKNWNKGQGRKCAIKKFWTKSRRGR